MAPTVTAVTPNHGPAAGGAAVSIGGSGFSPPPEWTRVEVGDQALRDSWTNWCKVVFTGNAFLAVGLYNDGTGKSQFFRSTDGAQTWTQITSPGLIGGDIVRLPGTNTVIAVLTNHDFVKSTDGGLTWAHKTCTLRGAPALGGAYPGFFASVVYGPGQLAVNGDTIVGTNGYDLEHNSASTPDMSFRFYSLDAGETWTADRTSLAVGHGTAWSGSTFVTVGDEYPNSAAQPVRLFTDPAVGYNAAYPYNISDDGARPTTDLATALGWSATVAHGHYPVTLASDGAGRLIFSQRDAYYGAPGPGYRSLDHGQTWAALTPPDSDFPYGWLYHAAGRFFCTAGQAVYASSDHGDTWGSTVLSPDDWDLGNVAANDDGSVILISGNAAVYVLAAAGGTASATFGGVAASDVVGVSDTEITCLTPAHAAGAVDVAVTVNGETATLAAGYTYDALVTLAVTSVTLSAGPTGGGLVVTVHGFGFTGASGVSFDGVAATSVSVVSDTEVTCINPAHAAGSVDVTVTAAGRSATLAAGFGYYILPPPPPPPAIGSSGRPYVRYRTYRSDDTSKPLFGPVVLEIQAVAMKREGASFEAKAPSLSISRTGRLYSLDAFPMLRGFI